jgi:hypothetical protein
MQNRIKEHHNRHLFRPVVSTDTSYTTSSVKHMNTAAAWKPLLQQLPSISLTFQNIPNRVNETTWKYSHQIWGCTLPFCKTGSIPYKSWVYQKIWKNASSDKEQLWHDSTSQFLSACTLSAAFFPLSPPITHTLPMLRNGMKSRQELLMVTHLWLMCHKIKSHTNLTHTWFYQLIILNDIFQLLFSWHENKTLTVVLLIQIFLDVTQCHLVCSSQHYMPINARNHSANYTGSYPRRPELFSLHWFFLPNNKFHIQKFFWNNPNIFFHSKMPKFGTFRVQYI